MPGFCKLGHIWTVAVLYCVAIAAYRIAFNRHIHVCNGTIREGKTEQFDNVY